MKNGAGKGWQLLRAKFPEAAVICFCGMELQNSLGSLHKKAQLPENPPRDASIRSSHVHQAHLPVVMETEFLLVHSSHYEISGKAGRRFVSSLILKPSTLKKRKILFGGRKLYLPRQHRRHSSMQTASASSYVKETLHTT